METSVFLLGRKHFGVDGLLPHTTVEFEFAGDHTRIRKADPAPSESAPGNFVPQALLGTSKTRMGTVRILALTHSEVPTAQGRK